MSYLANEIDRMLNEFKKIPADLVRASGHTPPQISRWRYGKQITIKPESLRKLALAFSSKSQIHARLLYASLQDARVGPGAKHISIELNLDADCLKEDSTPYKVKLPPPIQKDLDTIQNSIVHDREVRDLIHTIATSCRRSGSPQALPKKS